MDLKKTTFYLFTLFSLMLISCSNDDEPKIRKQSQWQSQLQ